MSVLDQHHPSHSTTVQKDSAGDRAGASSLAGGGDFQQQVQRLAPRENLPGVTIKGVTLSAQATGATFSALEKALGKVWARAARAAAAQGANAVLELFAPHLPAGADRLPLAHDIAGAYARWGATQPPIKADPVASKDVEDKGRDGEGQVHNLNVGQYGLMVALEAAIGTKLATLCPITGRLAKAHVQGACSVEGIYLALAFDAKAVNKEDGFEVSGEATISIGIGETNAGVAVNERIGVTGFGDDAVEAMHMAGLAIEHFIREQQFDWKNPSWDEVLSTGRKFLVNAAVLGTSGGGAGVAAAGVLALAGAKIADALWGKDFEHDVAQFMDEDDYGEHSVGVGVGGFVKPTDGQEDQPSLEASLDYKHATRVSRGEEQDIKSESDDSLDFSFSVGFGGGGWHFSLGGHIGGTFGGSQQAGFQVTMEKEEQHDAAEGVVADLIGAQVRGLIHGVGKRAHGFVGRIADAVDVLMRGHAAAKALAGAGGLELAGEWDSQSCELELELVVTRKLVDISQNSGAEALEVSFEIGEVIAEGKVRLAAPK